MQYKGSKIKLRKSLSKHIIMTKRKLGREKIQIQEIQNQNDRSSHKRKMKMEGKKLLKINTQFLRTKGQSPDHTHTHTL